MRLKLKRTVDIQQIVWDNRYFIVPSFILFILILAVVGFHGNDRLFLEINRLHSSVADFLFLDLTDLGNGVMAFVLVLILLLVSYRESLTFLSLTLILTFLVRLLKKVIFPGFIRPVLYFGSSSLHLIPGYNPPLLHTFPSGHTVTAFSACLFLSFLISKKIWKIFLFLVAIFIGYSRVYVSAHFPFDVVSGAFIAVVITTLVYYFSRQIHNDWIDKKIQIRLNRTLNSSYDT